jgi:predicted ATPase
VSWLGAVASGHTHLAQGIALDDPQHHRASALLYGEDAGVVCRSLDAWMLWSLGYPDQGLTRSVEGVTLAHQRVHPLSLAFALAGAVGCHQLRREVRATQEQAEAVLLLATNQGFPYWMAVAGIQRGWALAHQGQAHTGIAQLHQGLRAYHAIEAAILRPYWLALLAEAHGALGEPQAGLTALTEALTLVDSSGERFYEPELYRLKGHLLLQLSSDNSTEAESCFHHAITIARSQHAKSWELRTATSLARLWQQQGKRQEAHDLLAPVYNWFTEGFDTADLKDAKALLDELA